MFAALHYTIELAQTLVLVYALDRIVLTISALGLGIKVQVDQSDSSLPTGFGKICLSICKLLPGSPLGGFERLDIRLPSENNILTSDKSGAVLLSIKWLLAENTRAVEQSSG